MSKPNKTPLIIAAILFIFGLLLTRTALAMNPDNYEFINVITGIVAGIQFGYAFMLIGGYFDDQNKLMKEETKELIKQAMLTGERNAKREYQGVPINPDHELDRFFKDNNL